MAIAALVLWLLTAGAGLSLLGSGSAARKRAAEAVLPLAWISLAVLLVTLGAGLSWFARNAQAARRGPGASSPYPARLILVHGLAAAAVLALTVVTALAASHG